MQENKNSIIISTPPVPVAKYEDGNDNGPRALRRTLRPSCCGAFFLLLLLGWGAAQPATPVKSDKAPDSMNAVRALPVKDPVQAKVEALLLANKYALAKVAVLVKDIDRDSLLFSLNPDSMYNPASCSKLLTAAMAFDRLGTNHSFNTVVYAGTPVTTDTGTCHGNLYIKGCGDPYFVVERMWLFVQHLVCTGLKTIEGDIVLDASFFDSLAVGPGFDEDDSSHPYVAPVNAVSANFNCVSIWMRPGRTVGSPVLVDVLPKAATVKVAVTALTIAAGKPSTCGAATKKDGDKTLITVSGNMPLDAGLLVQYKKVFQTWEYYGAMFERLLNDNKIAFKGKVRLGLVPDSVKSRQPFYVFPSVPLYQAVNSMMKVSNNYMAEMIFKTLSAQADSTPGSWEKASALALSWWKEKKLPAVPKIKNGSGMGDSNRMSGRQIVELLRYVWGQKSYLPEYLYSLSSAGVDGTLKSRFKDSRLKGIVRAKTGTLNDYGVSTIAGYALCQNRNVAFAVMFNNCMNRKQMGHWEMQEKILEMVLPEK
jgi:serine-type D-Ala-D-Ala carboxypeptidase/endopeptidase (penicillin-binding protein 4)